MQRRDLLLQATALLVTLMGADFDLGKTILQTLQLRLLPIQLVDVRRPKLVEFGRHRLPSAVLHLKLAPHRLQSLFAPLLASCSLRTRCLKRLCAGVQLAFEPLYLAGRLHSLLHKDGLCFIQQLLNLVSLCLGLCRQRIGLLKLSTELRLVAGRLKIPKRKKGDERNGVVIFEEKKKEDFDILSAPVLCPWPPPLLWRL